MIHFYLVALIGIAGSVGETTGKKYFQSVIAEYEAVIP